ncbi:hypothetical protein [Pantoea stewartii]|uniref:hypothetical protein n=1 Tax=Pantoea stewartii TaxID=66269 RepID=UPI00197F55D3|nr:hypothetical protein [Pantoea stewartii]
MRQLTASEASNDEMERQRFESWLRNKNGFEHASLSRVDLDDKYFFSSIQYRWEAWQAALKSKQGEV